MKTVLVPPGNDWNWMNQRQNQLMREFSKNGYKVLWMQNKQDELKPPEKVEPNIYVYYNYIDLFNDYNSVDIIYTNWPRWYNYPIDHSLQIFDCIDFADQYIPYEPMMIANSDIVLSISRQLQRYLLDSYECDSSLIRNACDIQHLEQHTDMPSELKPIERPIVGYLGALIDWADKEALRSVGWEYSVVHVGIASQVPPHNIFHFDEKKRDDIARFFNNIDLGIHATTNSLTGRMGSPLKVFEYLACGKPVVCSYNEEIDDYMGDLVRMVPICGDYVTAVREEFAEDGIDKREDRIERMRSETWDKRYIQLVELVEDEL